MNTITQIINVTAKHITDGIRSEACRCPIALAIADQLLEGDLPTVATGVVVLKGFSAYLQPEADSFISDFDEGNPVEPFAFALDVPVREEDTEVTP